MAEQLSQHPDQRQPGCTAELLKAVEGRQIFAEHEESFRSQEWPQQIKLHLACNLQCTQRSVALF